MPSSPQPTVQLISAVDVSMAGLSILGCRYFDALTRAGIPSEIWVPNPTDHPDTFVANEYSSLQNLLGRRIDSPFFLGLHPDVSLAQAAIDHASSKDLSWVLWERPNCNAPEDVSRDLQNTRELKTVLTLNSLYVERIKAIVGAARVAAIPPAIPPDCFDAFDAEPRQTLKYAISTGRPTTAKGILRLADIWSEQIGPRMRLPLVIATPIEFEIGKRVEWVKVVKLGRLANRIRLIKGATFAIFPASSDHLPLALLETMAVGTTVIATEIDGHREVIRNGITGYTIDVELTRLSETVSALLHGGVDPLVRIAANELISQRYSYIEFVRVWKTLAPQMRIE